MEQPVSFNSLCDVWNCVYMVMCESVSARPARHYLVFRSFHFKSFAGFHSTSARGAPGGQTGGQGQTDCRTVGQTDGWVGRPSDGGPEYSLPAWLELGRASGYDRSRATRAACQWAQPTRTAVSGPVELDAASWRWQWSRPPASRAGLWPCSIFRPPTRPYCLNYENDSIICIRSGAAHCWTRRRRRQRTGSSCRTPGTRYQKVYAIFVQVILPQRISSCLRQSYAVLVSMD